MAIIDMIKHQAGENKKYYLNDKININRVINIEIKPVMLYILLVTIKIFHNKGNKY